MWRPWTPACQKPSSQRVALTRWRKSFCSGFEVVADEIRKESVAQAPEVASVATPTRTRPDCFRVQSNGPVNGWLAGFGL